MHALTRRAAWMRPYKFFTKKTFPAMALYLNQRQSRSTKAPKSMTLLHSFIVPRHRIRCAGVSLCPPDSSTCSTKLWQAFTTSRKAKRMMAPFTLLGKSFSARDKKATAETMSKAPSVMVCVLTRMMLGS